MCVHWCWRGEAAPPFEPLPTAPLPEQRTGEGRLRPLRTPCPPRRCRSSGRTGAQPPNPRSGALSAQRRTVAVTRVPRAHQALVRRPEALRLPTLGERANASVSGRGERRIAALVHIEDHPVDLDLDGRRLHPPDGGFVAFPQGYLAPQARAGSDPDTGGGLAVRNPMPGRFSGGKGGVTPSPARRPKSGHASGSRRDRTSTGITRVGRAVVKHAARRTAKHAADVRVSRKSDPGKSSERGDSLAREDLRVVESQHVPLGGGGRSDGGGPGFLPSMRRLTGRRGRARQPGGSVSIQGFVRFGFGAESRFQYT